MKYVCVSSYHVMQMRYERITRKSNLPYLISLFHTIPRFYSNTSRLQVVEMAVLSVPVIDNNVVATKSFVYLSRWHVGVRYLVALITIFRNIVHCGCDTTASRSING